MPDSRRPPNSSARTLWQLWQEGRQPELAPFVDATGELSPSQLVDVIRVDQRERWCIGERVPAATYLRVYPFVQSDPEATFELIYGEFLLREELGEVPEVAEYVETYPQHETRLRLQLDLHRALQSSTFDGHDSESDPCGTLASRARSPEHVTQRRCSPPAVAGYEILGEIGRGGMGVVYLARQLRLNRTVALKMIRAGEFASPELTARFLTEAEAVARLQHPHIVAIFDVGEHHGYPFLALEYVEGGSLTDRLRGKRWPAREAARVIETLAHAIHAAHHKGIIHRDLKPANILMTTEGEPKIADFGLAKLLGNDSSLTRSESILGSPYYMAPEQVGTKANRVGPEADIYSLGAMLYELLTGAPPFRGSGVLETLELAKTAAPVPPNRIQPGLSSDLETICLKCLEKDAHRRYASAEALAEDLRRFRADVPILARRTSALARACRWARRNPALAGMAAVTLFLLLTTLSVVAREWRRAEASLRHEIAINKRLTQANERERKARQSVQMRFALAIDAVKAYSRDASLALQGNASFDAQSDRFVTALNLFRKLKQQARDEIDREQGAELARAFQTIGYILKDIGATSEAEAALQDALSIRRSMLASASGDTNLRAGIAGLLAEISNLNRALQRLDVAIKLQEEALASWQELAREQPENLDCLTSLSWAYANVGAMKLLLGHPNESLEAQTKAREIRVAMLRLSPGSAAIQSDLAWADLDISNYHRMAGRHADALGPAKSAVTLMRQLVRVHPGNQSDRVRLAKCLNNLGLIYRDLEARDAAVRIFEEALKEWDRIRKESPTVLMHRREHADAFDNIAEVEIQRYRYDDALKAIGRAVALREEIFAEHPSDADLGEQLAVSLEQTGRLFTLHNRAGEAISPLTDATEIYCRIEKLSKSRSPRYQEKLVNCVRTLASAQIASGQWDEGLDSLRKSRSLASLAVYGQRTPGAVRRLGEIDNELGLAFERRGRTVESRRNYAEVYGACMVLLLRDRATEEARDLLNHHLFTRGYVLRDQGRTMEGAAMALFRSSLWPDRPMEIYNAACEFSMGAGIAAKRGPNSAEVAIESWLAKRVLRRAIRRGFADFELIRVDPDLATIRDQPGFSASFEEAIFPKMPFAGRH